MAEHWFYLESLPAGGEIARLDEREAHHAANVRRLHEGDEVRLFDGLGGIAIGRIREMARKRKGIEIAVRDVMRVSPPAPALHLASALPAHQNQVATMLSMGVQVGMSEITPLECAYGSKPRVDDRLRDRWRRIFIESCKQSRRPVLPTINDRATPEEVSDREEKSGGIVIVAHPRGEPFVKILRYFADRFFAPGARESEPPRITLMVGPEGGFTDHEVNAMASLSADVASLGDGILRVETAAVVMLASAMLAMRRSSPTI